jgi:exonuclease VII small subunit
MAIKGYVVRGMAPGDVLHEEARDALGAAVGTWTALVQLGAARPRIFRVHDDGREERLPSYEEALREIERLTHDLEDEGRRFQEARTDADVAAGLLAEANKEIERLREVLGCKAEEETHVVAERLLTEIERCVDALKGAVGPTPADPLAALEAAERSTWGPGLSCSIFSLLRLCMQVG